LKKTFIIIELSTVYFWPQVKWSMVHIGSIGDLPNPDYHLNMSLKVVSNVKVGFMKSQI